MSDSTKGFPFQTVAVLLLAAVVVYDIVSRDRSPEKDTDDVVVISDEVKAIKNALSGPSMSSDALVLSYAFGELAAIIEKEPAGNTTTGQSLFNTVDNLGFYRSLTSSSNKELQAYVAGQLKPLPKETTKLTESAKKSYVDKFKEMSVNFKKASE